MSDAQNPNTQPPGGPVPPPLPPSSPPLDYGTPSTAGSGYFGPPPDADSCNVAMLCHLLAIFTGFLVPLIIWLLKRDEKPFVDDQGKEALNFQITMILLSLACLVALCFAPVLLIGLHIVRLVFCIIATVQSSKGIAYRYPICFRLVK